MSAIIERLLCPQHSWNTIRLGDIGYFIRGLTYSGTDITEENGKTIVLRSNNIVEGKNVNFVSDIVRVNINITKELCLQKGDIIICMANGSNQLVGKNSFYNGGCPNKVTVGAFCGIYRTKEPLVKWLLQTQRYKRYIYQSIQGGNGAIANLNADDILNMKFHIPSSEESERYSSILTSLDDKLIVEDSLLGLLNEQKTFLVQRMFI